MTLSPRDAKLREEALVAIGSAEVRLSSAPRVTSPYMFDAFRATLYNRPRLALQRIAAAKKHLVKAEAALRKWAGR